MTKLITARLTYCLPNLLTVRVVNLACTHAKIIFTLALKTNSHSVLLCHNHPSGNLRPSDVDKELTKTISKAGHLIDIELIDHIIVSAEEEYFSFADAGILD